MEKAKKKVDITTIILIAFIVLGLSLILYPAVSDYVNSFSQSNAILSYSKAVSIISKPQYDRFLKQAKDYNEKMKLSEMSVYLSDEQILEYDQMLDIDGSGVMGYVDIPLINVSLPIYHGTSDGVLQKGVGHLEWTSLPIGGNNTHSVISGHRGLPSSKLFTDIDKLEIGDIFYLNILEDRLCYEVDQIRIVLPSDTSDLTVIDGEDLCTLMTCTPYGINTHRLLVRGHRIEDPGESGSMKISSNAVQINKYIVAFFIALPEVLILVFILAIKDFGKRNILAPSKVGEKKYEKN